MVKKRRTEDRGIDNRDFLSSILYPHVLRTRAIIDPAAR